MLRSLHWKVKTVMVFVFYCFASGVGFGGQISQKSDPDPKNPKKKFSLHLDVDARTWSRYQGNNGAIFHPGPVEQVSVTSPLKKGCYINLWTSTGLDRRNLQPDFGDEVDYTFGCARNVKGFGFDGGVSYFDVTDLFHMPGGDIVWPYLTISRNMELFGRQSLSPYFTLWTPLPASPEGPRKGVFTGVGMSHGFQLAKKLRLEDDVQIFHDTGAFGFPSGFLARYSVDLNWKAGGVTIRLPSVQVVTPLTVGTGRGTEAIFGGGIAFAIN